MEVLDIQLSPLTLELATFSDPILVRDCPRLIPCASPCLRTAALGEAVQPA